MQRATFFKKKDRVMDNSMVEVLMAQGMSQNEAYQRIAVYYQMLSEGCSRVEARKALRSDNALSYLGKLVNAAIRGIINKGFQPEEVEEAINEYYHPFTPEDPCEFDVPSVCEKVSDFPLDPIHAESEDSENVAEELNEFIRDDRGEW